MRKPNMGIPVSIPPAKNQYTLFPTFLVLKYVCSPSTSPSPTPQLMAVTRKGNLNRYLPLRKSNVLSWVREKRYVHALRGIVVQILLYLHRATIWIVEVLTENFELLGLDVSLVWRGLAWRSRRRAVSGEGLTSRPRRCAHTYDYPVSVNK